MFPMKRTKRSLLPLLLAMLLFALFPGSAFPQSSPPPLERRDIEFFTEDVRLGGTVLSPQGASDAPALVIVSGAGSADRSAYLREAEYFAQAGIIVLIYDKRPGYSISSASFPDLAQDALSALRALSQQPGVDPERTGLWGHSQGGWVVTLAASASPEPDFVISASGSGFPSDETQLWSNRVLLKHKGIADRFVEPVGIHLSRMLIAAGIYGDTSTDPAKILPSVRQPLLALFAEYDRVNPTAASIGVFERALQQGGQSHYWIRLVPGVNHDLRLSADGFERGGEILSPDHLAIVAEFLSLLPSPGIRIDRSDPSPVAVRPAEPLRFYESIPLHLLGLSLLLLSALFSGLRYLLRRRKGGLLPVLFVSLNLLIAFGAVGYLGTILFTGAWETGPILLGRPLIWLLLQGMLLFSAGIAAVLAGRALRSPLSFSARMREYFPAAISGAVLLALSAYWGLLLP